MKKTIKAQRSFELNEETPGNSSIARDLAKKIFMKK